MEKPMRIHSSISSIKLRGFKGFELEAFRL